MVSGCKSSEEFSGFSYDPPDVANTATKEITPQPLRVIGLGNPKIWVSNEYAAARLNDAQLIDNNHIELTIAPELAPINNSAWYAFKIWSDSSQKATVTLTYKDGSHRYFPKLSSDGQSWAAIDSASFSEDTANGTASLNLQLSTDTLWVSAQERKPTSTFERWLTKLSEKPFVDITEIGRSHQLRPVKEIRLDHIPEGQPAKTLLVLSRQHPPEVTGYMTALSFLEEIADTTALAKRFRQKFTVLAYPMMNPDGADNGHWRYNAGGVDLNRDWTKFNQPETRAVRDAITNYLSDSLRSAVYGIDFHSTDENIFYTILPEIPKPKGDISYPWANTIIDEFPGTTFVIDPFDTSSPVSKNWFYNTFGIDAITYEVNDDIDREKSDQIARFAARSLMKQLLESQ